MDLRANPHFVPGPYTLEKLWAALDFSVFYGTDADDPGTFEWELFNIDGCTMGDVDAASQVVGLNLLTESPCRDDDACLHSGVVNPRTGRPYDDDDALLAYLRGGGALCKVPDEIGSKFCRYFVVVLPE